MQDLLQGLHIPSGLGTPRVPPGEDGECRWGQGCLGFSPEPVALSNPISDKWMTMDGCMFENVKVVIHLMGDIFSFLCHNVNITFR